MNDDDRYVRMRDTGATPAEVCEALRAVDVDDVVCIRILRTTFGLSLVDAKQVMFGGALEAEQAKLALALEVASLVDGYDDGTETLEGVMSGLVALVLEHRVDDVVGALPADWQARFIAWAVERFDNAVPAEEFLQITNGTDDGTTPELVRRVRVWLRGRSARDG